MYRLTQSLFLAAEVSERASGSRWLVARGNSRGGAIDHAWAGMLVNSGCAPLAMRLVAPSARTRRTRVPPLAEKKEGVPERTWTLHRHVHYLQFFELPLPAFCLAGQSQVPYANQSVAPHRSRDESLLTSKEIRFDKLSFGIAASQHHEPAAGNGPDKTGRKSRSEAPHSAREPLTTQPNMADGPFRILRSKETRPSGNIRIPR